MSKIRTKPNLEKLTNTPIPMHIRAHHRIYATKRRTKIIALRGE
ncbi:hypothetical protein [uncultured Helicobacter sp.]